MVETHKPGFAASLIRIHSVITRALDVTVERSQAFAQEGFPDDPTRAGFVSYVQSFVSLLNAHHLTEDELVFPYFREKMPDARFDLLTSQHQKMIPLLDEIKGAIEKAAADTEAREALNRLSRATASLVGIWHPHIKREQNYFTSKRVDALIDLEEQIRLNRLSAEHSQKHSGPDYLVIPFMLYNLSDQDRAIMAQQMPPIVTQQLVPIVWKEKWEPMLPFLLK